ncbi:MAG TPA: tRNA adenosine(34) deaminase TadA [Actinomycetota bacterium]|nr:tRNA adenosine(34) deaminase TadA [Actinomycetota bacterium]
MSDDDFMRMALAEAEAALAHDDVPVGCVIVRDDVVIGRGHNARERDQDPTAHAEIIALREAAAASGSWRIEDATLYVTLEPCFMCAGAMVLGRIPRLVFGAIDPKAGACGSLHDVVRDPRLNHRMDVTGGVLAAECGQLLRRFFAARR